MSNNQRLMKTIEKECVDAHRTKKKLTFDWLQFLLECRQSYKKNKRGGGGCGGWGGRGGESFRISVARISRYTFAVADICSVYY